jgi:hypothetical protein
MIMWGAILSTVSRGRTTDELEPYGFFARHAPWEAESVGKTLRFGSGGRPNGKNRGCDETAKGMFSFTHVVDSLGRKTKLSTPKMGLLTYEAHMKLV